MRSGRFNYILISLLLILFFTKASAEIFLYPVPPGLTTSLILPTLHWLTINRYGLNVSEASLQHLTISLYGSRDMEDLNVAAFSCSGAVTIMVKANANIDSFNIRPKSRNIKATVNGSEITFTINGPQKLYIEINNLPHLAIFADPPEVNPHKKGDSGVIYYGPGVHNPGTD